ncbi:MAG TPA: TatD family hydrolase [Chthoniobacteraceae bacterium]|nr:TatD family hydrolase [Chthoniobacteraceae bacterium]
MNLDDPFMLIDTHAHLTFKDFADDLEGVIARAAEAGVTRIITIGTSLESSRLAVELAEKYPGVFATVGIHPDNAVKLPLDFIANLRALARSPRVVAIGEIGLDYFRRSQERIAAEKSIQAAVFTQQLELAGELGLNVEIHERDAWDDLLALLAPFAGGVRGQFHCFSKSLAHAEAVIAHGHFVSFTGIATFKNASVVQDTAARVSPGSFMVETDCPYLAPVPFRGKRCEPAHTRATAEHIATLRGMPIADLAAETTATAESFFRFPTA